VTSLAVPQLTAAPERAPSSSPILVRRCACGGTPGVDGECAACRAKRLQRSLLRAPLEVGPPDDQFEREAEQVAEAVARGTRDDRLRRSPLGTRGSASGGETIGLGPGTTLPPSERAFMQDRLGHDFRSVRIHTGEQAAASAQGVEARAFTVGSDVVFGAGEYAPGTTAGRKLLAHELTHVAQGDASAPRRLRRTPARKVSCAPGPLRLADGTEIADPVAVLTDAENGANATLDAAIDELSFTIDQINAGAPVGWPTISDNLGHAISVMGLDPNDAAVWSGRGIGTAGLLLRRWQLVRGTIGAGSFFFTCIGPATGSFGNCAGDICANNPNAVSCAGSFRIFFCDPYWHQGAEAQAETLLHESFHNFAAFIQDAGREGNAGCYSRSAQIAANVDPAFQRADLCPDP
jgi:Domain of unknown function (DUF4157)